MKLKIGTYIDGRDGARFTITDINDKEITYYWQFNSTAIPPQRSRLGIITTEAYFRDNKFTYAKPDLIRAYINLL